IDPSHPPVGWYTAIAFPREGIRTVFPGSPQFNQLDNRIARQKMWEWGHSHRERDEESKTIAREADAYVKTVTGFDAARIQTYSFELQTLFAGRQYAPFPVD